MPRYLITFACYGWHLHGQEEGSVDRCHNLHGSRLVRTDPSRVESERGRMNQPPYQLDQGNRNIVLQAIKDVCTYSNWILLAAHARTNHVHAVVEAGAAPERVMNAFKSYASRSLNRAGSGNLDQKRWARHGSTRWLWKEQEVTDAIRYVVERQGEPMAVFKREEIEFGGTAP